MKANSLSASASAMQSEILIARLYKIARGSLASANKGNPFISKSAAMQDINSCRAATNKPFV